MIHSFSPCKEERVYGSDFNQLVVIGIDACSQQCRASTTDWGSSATKAVDRLERLVTFHPGRECYR